MKPTAVIPRRRFLRGGALAAASCAVSNSVLSAGERNAGAGGGGKDGRLRIAAVGLGVRGLDNCVKCEGAEIVALCDVDWRIASAAFNHFPDAARYRDYRRMLDREKDIDAVVVSTPDHTHAVITAEAMRRGKHVYTEAPLAHSQWEAREVTRIAAETGVTTQMGNERHSGKGIRQAVEMIWGGGLGPINEVLCWTNRPQWPQGIGRPASAPSPHPELDWDLWLGPARKRPFNPAYHPYKWRGWQDFGTGALGAMGCHLMDLAFWGLKLGEIESFTVEAESSGINTETFPRASTVRYRFPARGNMPPVVLTWYDGGRKPPTPEKWPAGMHPGSNGSIFVGEKHPMIFGPCVSGTTPGQVGPRTIPEFQKIEYDRSAYRKIPTVKDTNWKQGNRHIQEWIAACKQGKQPCANFSCSGPLTEMVMMGNAALRSSRPLEWKAPGAGDIGNADGNPFIRSAYRKGWSL